MAKILDGKIVRDKIAEDLKEEISQLKSKPKLVIVQVGDLAESNTYIRQKVLFGEKIGAIVQHKRFNADISQKALTDELLTINHDLSIHGVIVQLPIPKHLDKDKIIDSINPVKDVDGQTSTNIKLLFEGKTTSHPEVATTTIGSRSTPRKDSIASLRSLQNDRSGFRGFTPATTRGILALLDYYQIPIAGKKVVIVGRSTLVGKPTALAFLNRDATVTICHSKTEDLASETKKAHILIVAVGQINTIKTDHVSANQIVIDVGINVIASEGEAISKKIATNSSSSRNDKIKPESEPPARKLVGDVDFDSVKTVVSAITPVPGGIGPMTVASLFQNLLEAYKSQK